MSPPPGDDLGTYSTRWFELFLDRIPTESTANEIAFLTTLLPLPDHRFILDLCCGPGRHAATLATLGYEMTGVDRDERAIARARASDPHGEYHCADVREMRRFSRSFDAAICMWASFGGFTDAENLRFLETTFANVRPAGRIVLDIYNPSFFQNAEPVRARDVDGLRIIERKRIRNKRLHVTLDYEDGQSDHFQWRIFTIEELVELIRPLGGNLIHACAEFRIDRLPSSSIPRMQVVFESSPVG